MMEDTQASTSREKAAAWAAAAEEALSNQQWEAAAKAYEALVEHQPKNSDHRFNLVQAYDELGRLHDAVRVLEHPSLAHLEKTKRRLARTYIDLKDYAAAIPLVDELISAHPDNPKFAKWKAMLDERSGPDQAAADRMQHGQRLFDSGQFEEAEQVYLQLLKDYPGVVRASLYLGKIYAQQKRWAEAIPALRTGLTGDPADAKLRHTLARALFKNGDLEEAVRLLEDPGADNDVDGLFLLQRAQIELHHWARAQEVGDRLLQMLPADDALRERVTALQDEARFKGDVEPAHELLAAGRIDEAFDQLRKVAERHEHMPAAWLTLGSALSDAGRFGEAATALRAAAAIHPDNLEVGTALSRAVIKSAEENEILEHVRSATAGGSGDFESHRWLARYHGDRGEWPQSLENARNALALDPTSASARILLARALVHANQLTEALEELEILLAAGEKRAEALHLKAEAYVRLSRVEEAIGIYCQALRLSRRDPVIVERLNEALLADKMAPYPMRSLAELPIVVDPAAIERAMQPFMGFEMDDFAWNRRQNKVWRRAIDRVAAGQQSTRDRDLVEQEYAVWATMGFDRYRIDRKDLTRSIWSWRGRRLFLDGAAAARVRAIMLAAVFDQMKPRRVLEVGSGNGINLLTLAGAFPEIEFTGIELTDEGVQEARRAQNDGDIASILHDYCPVDIRDSSAIQRINFIQGDASALPFGDDSFDLVITILAVEQMENIRSAALSEIARVTSRHVLMLEPFRDLNQGGLQALYVRSRGYFRGAIAGLREFCLEPLWATDDFPQETFLGTALVLAEKQCA